jgi:glycosyltransferase involved in cell wall biosynthesis
MATKAPRLEIALAVYGGERGGYLEQQLKTLFAQTHQDWHLLVRDDASPDHTLEILRDWRARHPGRITIVDEAEPRRLGICGNFTRVLEATQASYVMLCDHDDLWYANKIENAVTAMQCLETRYGAATPLISHTDLRPVDQNLNEIAPSFWRYIGFLPTRTRSLGEVCISPAAAGPTMIVNRSLLSIAGAIPLEAVYQDRWLELVAFAFGHIDARNEISMDYRRHSLNNFSLEPTSLQIILRMLRSPMSWRQGYWQRREPYIKLAQAFLERFSNNLTVQQRKTVEAVACFRAMGFWERRRAILEYKIYYTSMIYTIFFLILA